MVNDPGESLEERMKRLQGRLNDAKVDDGTESAAAADTRKGYSQGLKISSEFIAAVIVGAMIGYLLDMVLPTKPWGLIVFLLLGFCAGVMNVLRVVGMVKSPHPVDRLGAANKRDNKR